MAKGRQRWRFWSTQAFHYPTNVAVSKPTVEDRRTGHPWPIPPEWNVRMRSPDSDYFIDVEIYNDEVDGPIVTGIAVRTGAPLKRERKPNPNQPLDWQEGADIQPVSPRDVRRLPLATFVRAAQAIVRAPLLTDDELKRALRSTGGPGKGYSTRFYRDLLDSVAVLAACGEAHPVRVIAARQDVPENRVHQWLHRARVLDARGALPSSRRSRGGQDESQR